MKKLSWTFVIFYWGKIVGLNPLNLTKNNKLEYSYFGMLYGCILSASAFYVTFYVSIQRITMLIPADSPVAKIVDFIGIMSGLIESIFTWLYTGFYQNRVKVIIEDFAKLQRILEKLGIQDNYEKCLKNFGLWLIIVNTIYVTWMACYTSTSYVMSNSSLFLWTFYSIMRMSALTTGTSFLWIISLIKEKLHQLNEEVRFIVPNKFPNKVLLQSTIKSRFVLISQIHRQLTDLIQRILQHFAVFIVFNMLSQITCLTIDVHIVYRYLKQHNGPFTTTDVFFIMNSSLWIFFPIMVLTVTSIICGSVSDEANKTGNILYTIFNDIDVDNSQTIAEFYILSLYLLKNPVKMFALGFLELDSSFVFRTLSTATTYLTIMLQFAN